MGGSGCIGLYMGGSRRCGQTILTIEKNDNSSLPMTQPIMIKPGSPEMNQPAGRPNVLVIAGYDQSGGAGVLADSKTLESHGVYGYAVCTGMTFQNELLITRVQLFTEKELFEQIDLCCQSARFDSVKIGICRSVTMIASVLPHRREPNPALKINRAPASQPTRG